MFKKHIPVANASELLLLLEEWLPLIESAMRQDLANHPELVKHPIYQPTVDLLTRTKTALAAVYELNQ